MPLPHGWRRTLARRPWSLRRVDLELDDGLLERLDAVTSWRVVPRRIRLIATSYPNLVFEVAMLLACIDPPPAGARRARVGAARGVLPLHFIPRAAYPVGYFLKTHYDCSPETMAGWTLENREREVVQTLRRLHLGIADLVDRAYEGMMEARPCRTTTPR